MLERSFPTFALRSYFLKGNFLLGVMQWTDKDEKLLKTIKFPPILDNPVDTSKIQLDVLRPWVEV